MARIVVHIGAHKTATSYLQARLAANRDLLAEHGVIYPDCGGRRNHACLAAPWVTPRVPESHYGHDTPDAHFNAFVQRYADMPGTVLISAEIFSRSRPSRVDMTELASRLEAFEQAHVVFVVREQPSFVQSVWLQRSRSGDNPENLDRFVARVLDTGFANGMAADFNPVYDRAAEGFGAGNVTVFDYAALRAAPGGPLGAFLRLLGVDLPAEEFRDLAGPAQANVSPDPLSFELARAATRPDLPSDGLMQACRRKLGLEEGRRTTLLTRDQHARLIDRFAPLNRELVRKVRRFQPEFGFEIPPIAPDLFHRDDIGPAAATRLRRAVARRALCDRLVQRFGPWLRQTELAKRHINMTPVLPE